MDTITSSYPTNLRASMALGALLVTLLVYLTQCILKIGSRPAGFPPGPPTRPIWGNLKELNTLHPHLTYTHWSRTLRLPLLTTMRGPVPIVVVNTAAAAHQIFNKRGHATSGRPAGTGVDLHARGGYAPAMMSGPPWRAARRMWHAILNVGAARSYLPYQALEAARLVADVCGDGDGDGERGGEEWRGHVERFSNSVGMTMLCGRRVPRKEDPGIREAMDDLMNISLLALRTEWMEGTQWLWDLPGARWWLPPLREVERLAGKHLALNSRLWENAKGRGENQMPNFMKAIQEKLKAGWEGMTEGEGMEVASELLIAATDTTASTMSSFMAAMALFPDVQRKAQEEIDRVVGPDRLPENADTNDLPYTRQVIQETLRWLTVVPLSLPHATTEPIQIGEYHIPANTTVVLNSYAIHTDPETYPNPREFRPERWEGKLEAVVSDDQIGARTDLFAFGAGRRVCVGQHVAESNLFYAISHWLWAFDIRKKRNAETGEEIGIDMDDVRPGLVITMNPFEVDVKPRSRGKSEWIRAYWKKQRELLLDEDEQWIQSPDAVAKVMARTAR